MQRLEPTLIMKPTIIGKIAVGFGFGSAPAKSYC